jgi:hypothetical protein
MIVVLAVLTAFILVYSVVLGIYLAENSGVLEEQILKDYLDTLGDDYEIHTSEYYTRIYPKASSNVRRNIEISPIGFKMLFPYYIEDIGVIPFWSKSKTRIDTMFTNAPKKDWKRERLGLK